MAPENLNGILKILASTIVLAPLAIALAQQPGGGFGIGLDSKTLSVQAKAEELYERGDFRRAHVIYLNDLAPIGDKYAQYMLGFMSLSGLGVEQDPVLASAWYRLAAERGEPAQFVRIRDELLGNLDEVDRARSDQVYLSLRRDYSDISISMREVREAFDDLARVTTGSRIGRSPSSAVTIVDPRAGSGEPGDALIHRTQNRMQRHLDNVTATLGVARISAQSLTVGELSSLEEQVQEYVEQLDER